jgi:hypothetical protein
LALASHKQRIQAGCKNVVKVIEGEGRHCKRKQWTQPYSLEALVSLLKGLYKFKEQTMGKNI